MEKQKDIEIYIKDSSLPRVAEWLETKFGAILEKRESPDADMTHFTIEFRGQPITVTATEGYQFPPKAGTYTSLYFVASEFPWRNDVECAREAISFFGTAVICDATTLGNSAPDQWLQVTGEGEELFLSS
jgi:hypothetical protein